MTTNESSIAATRDDCAGGPVARPAGDSGVALLGYLATGTALGVVFMRSEVLSWYRIQEMFRFQAGHMFGVIAVAIGVAAVSRHLLARVGVPAGVERVAADAGSTSAARPRLRHLLGGVVFGLGWALLGACPGPIFTLIGAGHSVYLVSLASAVAGTWLYGLLQAKLPH